MNRSYPIPQSYVWVARIGVSSVTRAAAPAHDSAAWLKFGNCPSATLGVEVERKERKEIVLGQRISRYKEIGRKFNAKGTIEELNKLVIDLLFRSNVTANDNFISHGSLETVAWTRFQSYDETDANITILEGLAFIQPTGDIILGGEEHFKAEFEFHFEGKVSGKLIAAYT
jgi:hypothetical protein